MSKHADSSKPTDKPTSAAPHAPKGAESPAPVTDPKDSPASDGLGTAAPAAAASDSPATPADPAADPNTPADPSAVPTDAPPDPAAPVPELSQDGLSNPNGLRVFRGDIPAGFALVGVFLHNREQEELYLAPVNVARARTLSLQGVTLDHVSEGPDGRWQYGDNRR